MDGKLMILYSKKVGTASVSVEKVVAGSTVSFRLVYTVGEFGIDDSGAIKILFRIVTDAQNLQFSNKNEDNFVSLSSSNKSVIFKFNAQSTGYVGKLGVRPWTKGFMAVITNTNLAKGDTIFFDFKNWHTQTFCEKRFEFKISVDAFATGDFIDIANPPQMEVLPDKPTKIQLLAPSLVKPRTTFKVLAKIEDQWGNPCHNANDAFKVIPSERVEKKSGNVKFKNGRTILEFSASKGVNYVTIKYKKLTGISNPIVIDSNFKNSHYWADLHGQSEETVGTSSINEYFDFGKNYGFLDVGGHQGNDFQISNSFWQKINETTKTITEVGKFVALPGYEWSGNTSNGGDRNIYHINENQELLRSSHALVQDVTDLVSDVPKVNELFKKFDPKKTLIVAHVGGRFADISMHDEKVEKLIEVHSVWGTFEWFINQAFDKKYKVGVVAGGDGHTGRLGAEHPGTSEFISLGGLTCILATSLTRKNIFEALRNRHCYGTTGARIFLNIEIPQSNCIMGDEISLDKIKEPKLLINVVGTNIVDRVDVRNGSKIVNTWFPKIDKESTTFKILWMGANAKGRSRKLEWTGSIGVTGSKVVSNITPINFHNPNNNIKLESGVVKFNGATSGGVQGLTLELDKNQGKINLKINNKNFEFNVNEIKQKPILKELGLLDAGVEISRVSSDKNDKIANFVVPITKLNAGFNAINIKVVQQDGHMAWSSPIFITR